jgi:glutathione synthase/RimK-type ligase-like ATP-grasp enzyme
MWKDKNITLYQRIAQNGEFRANFSLGADLLLYEFDEKISKIAKKIMHQFSLDFVGIDMLFDGEKYFVCEINTAPGFL